MRRDFTLVIVKEGEWYAGFIKEVPGAITQGKSIEEVQDNIKEALEMVLESNTKHMFDDLEVKPEIVKEELVTVDVRP
ncbi:MAG: type II toxin-antitoxin system HicB family antitoxin [Nitrospirae bacterium]|nr:type II toxin-antitoxin system HicB family antitoxin [Nitrospirota bacterium]